MQSKNTFQKNVKLQIQTNITKIQIIKLLAKKTNLIQM